MLDDASAPLTYRPNESVLEHIRLVSLVGVVGPSGAGKTTLVEAAIAARPELHLVVGDTSRAPRPGEQNGEDYHFRSREEMLRRIKLREYVQVPPDVTGDLYATAPASYTTSGVSLFAVWAAAVPMFRQLPFKQFCTVFIVPPSFAVWQERLGDRNALPQRMVEARQSFQFALDDKQTWFIINDDLGEATNELIYIANNHSLTPKLIADQPRAREIIADILRQLP